MADAHTSADSAVGRSSGRGHGRLRLGAGGGGADDRQGGYRLDPRRDRAGDVDDGTGPRLPAELQGALHSLYEHYEKSFVSWRASAQTHSASTPPVFIVVCNNTAVSKLIFDYLAGWEKPLPDGSTVPVPGELVLFSNVENDQWTHRPNTILVDSEQLESGESMSDEFKRLAATQIEEFKALRLVRKGKGGAKKGAR